WDSFAGLKGSALNETDTHSRPGAARKTGGEGSSSRPDPPRGRRPPDGGTTRGGSGEGLALTGNTGLTISGAVRKETQSGFTKTGKARKQQSRPSSSNRAGTRPPHTI